jgi:hypothetical protein
VNRGEFRELLERMAAGWNGGDAAAVADCFAERVSYADPTRYSFSTRDELLPFFEPPEGGTQCVVWHRVLFDEAEQTGAAEYTYEGHNRYHGAVIATVADGRVTAWREWQHTSELDWEAFVGQEW